jgi:hypothetical protein
MDKISAQALEPYEEPAVEDVPLKAEETMLGPCKGNGFSAGVNGKGTSCRNPLTHQSCKGS